MSKDSAAKRDRKLLLEGFFSAFDEKPIASASIGQVHCAILKAGSHRVVVKLVYTEIKQTMDVDLDNMRRGMLLAMKTLKVKANPMPIVHEIYKSFPTECNFLNELEYLNCIRSNMAKRGDAGKVVVPNCYTHITTQNMLVLEHLDGKTFYKLKVDSMSAAELAAARRALIAVIDEIGKEIVLDGLFQYASVRSAAMRRCSCSASHLVGVAVRTRIRGMSCCWRMEGLRCSTSANANGSTEHSVRRSRN